MIYNYIIIVFLVYYTFYFYSLLFSSKRKNLQEVNKQLNELRTIPVKTLEEQKKFLDLKDPKKGKFKFNFSWKIFFRILLYLSASILLFKVYNLLFSYYECDFTLFHTILFIVFVPLIINFILSKFNLENDNLSIFLKWK